MLNVKQKIAWLRQNTEKILIIVFFATFTLNIRKVFLTPYSFLNGGFNEYTTISLSWADALMLLTILIYAIKYITSQFEKKASANALLENVIRNKSSVIRNYYRNNVSRETLFLFLFLLWAGLSIFWSAFKPIAFYRLLTLVEVILFALVAIKSLNSAKWRNSAYYAFITAGLFQAMLGIAQFIHNSSLELHFLGESILGPNIDGVAKIIIDGQKHIRAYGTMPHPNILAGFLIISLFLLTGEIIGIYVSRETLFAKNTKWLLWLILPIIGSGFFLTFSRSAFLGLFVGLAVLLIFLKKNNHFDSSPFSKGGLRGISAVESKNPSPAPCPKCLAYRSRRVPLGKGGSRKYFFLFLIFSFLLVLFISLLFKTSFFSRQSVEERTLFQNVSYETILNHPIHGVGAGQFVINAYYAHPNLVSWQYQPVHNIYLLIFSELGIIGFSIFLLFAIFLLSQVLEDKTGEYLLTYCLFYCIVISFFVISLFDHYFWDIKIGTVIFSLPIIFLLAANRNQNKFDKK